MGKLRVKTDSQAGFTLVELAVVMIIIGLLIGGILKGQELITNAQVTSAVSQMKGMDAAVTTFRDTYAAVPGDMPNAVARLPNCVAPCADPGANGGNNRIDDVAADAFPAAGQENALVWLHLGSADLINGVDTSGNMNFGESLPEASIGGGYFLGFHDGVAALNGLVAANARAGHYLALTGNPAANVGAAGTGVLRASQAARIDRKMDDGGPTSGTVLASDDGNGCDDGATPAAYDEANDPFGCGLYVRIQQ